MNGSAICGVSGSHRRLRSHTFITSPGQSVPFPHSIIASVPANQMVCWERSVMQACFLVE